ncbi:MAG TPA: anti-sigma factor [Propionibacteriaceae bacterium]|nr:anti-sigma factor [Propionibacteriaceae bacterium]
MHPDPELLALLALGEQAGDAEERAHVSQCPICSQELAELTALTVIGRSATAEDRLARPSAAVWDRIRAELAFEDPVAPGAEDRAEATDEAPANSEPSGAGAALPPRAPMSRRSLRWMALAAVLALIAGIGVGAGWQQLRRFEEIVVADATLDAFPKYPGSTGRAVVETDPDGSRFLVVEVSTPDRVQEMQVWMIKTTGTQMRALGFLNENGRARLPLPTTMTLSQFPIVDISDEPLNDTNLAHSGNTVVRGTLDI